MPKVLINSDNNFDHINKVDNYRLDSLTTRLKRVMKNNNAIIDLPQVLTQQTSCFETETTYSVLRCDIICVYFLSRIL